MKSLTDQLRELARADEFDGTTTARLFLEIANRAEALEADNANLAKEKARLDHLLATISPIGDGDDYAINLVFTAEEARDPRGTIDRGIRQQAPS